MASSSSNGLVRRGRELRPLARMLEPATGDNQVMAVTPPGPVARHSWRLSKRHARSSRPTCCAGQGGAQRSNAIRIGWTRCCGSSLPSRWPAPGSRGRSRSAATAAGICASTPTSTCWCCSADASAPLRRNSSGRSLHPLWDLGVVVGHQVRELEDFSALEADNPEFLLALLDARPVAGLRVLFDRFRALFHTAATHALHPEVAARS